MFGTRWLAVGSLALTVLPLAQAQDECVPTAADPATVNVVDAGAVGIFYVEERNGLYVPVVVPGSGLLIGDGTWAYVETNTLDGLQRGGDGLLGPAVPPGCTPWDPLGGGVPPILPCVLTSTDPLADESCGHGPDSLVL